MIVTTIDTLKKYIPTIVGNDFSKYESEVREANNWLKRELTGSDLYAILDQAGNEELLSYAEAVVARKAYLEGIPSFDLMETEAGFVVTRNDNQAPASPERVKKLAEQMAKKLSDAIEDLLEYLEEQVDYHDEWKGSPAYSLLSDTYILTLKDFRKYAPFEGNRLAFLTAKPQMMDAIHLQIEPVISPELSDQIIEQLRDDDMTAENKSILENLRFAFANFTIGKKEVAQSYLMKVRKVIMATPDNYAAFRDSSLYATIQATVIEKNTAEKPIFRAGF
ncbi:DUF6712 family protein [Mangrovibacterium sp.]|uniref:DUF6712 family protein n=1 Tax=Mangrovibacterium sp. TaxID=1961364 RepID=UPI00356AD207